MEAFRALWVGDRQSAASLIAPLQRLRVSIQVASNCRQARQALADNGFQIILTEVSLEDGNWCTVLREIVEHGVRAAVLVCAPRLGERLWSEVVSRGGYYALSPVEDTRSVTSVIEQILQAAAPSSPGGLSAGAHAG